MAKNTLASLAARLDLADRCAGETSRDVAMLIASMQARIDALEAAAAAPAPDSADHAGYVRDFFRAKRAEKQSVALRAPRPESESPTFRQLLLQASAQHDIPMHQLSFRGGKVMHGKTELSVA